MPANVGNQTVTIKFYEPVDSHIVNKRFFDVRPRGIYKGGYLSITAGNVVSVSALVCEIGDGSYQVRIETTIAVSITLTQTTAEYIVLRWTYAGATTDYMQILAVGTPSDNDVVVGKGVWVGATLTNISYVDRTFPEIHNLFLKVEPTDPASTSVRIRAGRAHRGVSYIKVSERTLVISGAAGYKYIYLTDSGGVAVSGTLADYAGKPLLARINWSGAVITASNIDDLRCFLTQYCVPDGSSLEKDGTTGKMRVKALGIQNSHINSNVPDGTTIEKDGTTGKLKIKTPLSFCRAWAHVAANGTLLAGFNATSVRTAVGRYTITWGTDFSSANYAVVYGVRRITGVQLAVNTLTQVAGLITVEVAEQGTGDRDAIFSVTAFGSQG